MSAILAAPHDAAALQADALHQAAAPTISTADLIRWVQCPWSYQIQHVEGFQSASSPAALLGTMVRQTLQFLYRSESQGEYPDIDDLEEFVAGRWDRSVAEECVSFSSVSEERAHQEQAVALLLTYLENRPPDEGAPVAVGLTGTVRLVDPSSGEDLGVDLVGSLDLVLEAPQGLLPVEFKTASRVAPAVDVMYELKLACDAYLLRCLIGDSESALEVRRLIKTKVPKIQYQRWRTRTDVHFRRLFAVIRAHLEDRGAGRFIYRPSLACSWCDYRNDRCQGWQRG